MGGEMGTNRDNSIHDVMAFSPAMLALQSDAPSPLPRVVLWTLAVLVAATLVWATFGRLDVVSVAQGKLVPQSYLQVSQPADGGIVRDLLVREGELVEKGQVLARLDPAFSESDSRQIQNDLLQRRSQLARIEAELGSGSLRLTGDYPSDLVARTRAQLLANRRAYLDTLNAQHSARQRAEQDLRSAREIEARLRKTAPIYEAQEQGWKKLADEGFASRLLAMDRERLRIENEQALKAQMHTVASLQAAIEEANQRVAQITSAYRQQLEAERVETSADIYRLEEAWSKQSRRHALLELRAPGAGIVKDLATHTVGAVVQPGTVLFTIVPSGESLKAEVWVPNADIGFVRQDQSAKVKVATYPFQKFGMVEGTVRHVGADASDMPNATGADNGAGAQSRYRALVELRSQSLERDGFVHTLTPGMQVSAEITLGQRTVLEYVLSPVRKAFQEAGRER
jgi:HlyD family secretion protein